MALKTFDQHKFVIIIYLNFSLLLLPPFCLDPEQNCAAAVQKDQDTPTPAANSQQHVDRTRVVRKC